MIILIAGDTHTGKTNLAQKLLEHFKIPYLSIDHLNGTHQKRKLRSHSGKRR